MEEGSINLEKVKKLREFAKKNYNIIFFFLVISVILMIIYMIANIEYVKYNSCQLCEISGRDCFELNSSKSTMFEISDKYQRIKMPELVRSSIVKTEEIEIS